MGKKSKIHKMNSVFALLLHHDEVTILGQMRKILNIYIYNYMLMFTSL